MSVKLRLNNFFHDATIRKEFDDIKGVRDLEGSPYLGVVNSNLPIEEMRRQLQQILDMSVLSYLIRGWGERAVWDYIKTLDYPYVANYRTIPPSKEDFPSGVLDERILSEIPEIFEVIDELPVEDAAYQLMMIANGLTSHSDVYDRFAIPPFEYGKNVLEKAFEYSEDELTLQGIWGGVRFELPKNPKQLLKIGAVTRTGITHYAWCPWRHPFKFIILMFDVKNDNYIGYCMYFEKSFSFYFFACDDDFVEKNFGEHPALWNVVRLWLEDERTKVHF